MKILFFAASYYPHIGGVEKHLYEISKRLINQGHQITIITERESDLEGEENFFYHSDNKSANEAKKSKEIDKSIQIDTKKIRKPLVVYLNFGKKNWFKKFRIWLAIWKQRELIRSSDLVHCHDVFIWYLPFRFLFFRKPVYTTFHGYEEYPLRKKTLLIRKISEILSWGNICIGDFIPKWYRTKPNFVSYGGVDFDRFKNKTVKTKNGRSALFFGRLDEQTGIDTYVEAYKIIKNELPDFELTVIGDGKHRNKIDKEVSVLGFKENIEDYFSSSHFVFVSRYLSILEAFAAKHLVFAVYDNPVKEDYLKMAPWAKYVVIANSGEEIASKIRHYLKHPDEEKEFVNSAYDWVKNQTWDNVVDTYKKLWSV